MSNILSELGYVEIVKCELYEFKVIIWSRIESQKYDPLIKKKHK